MTCKLCKDGAYPHYGVAPHKCFYKIPGAVIGESELLPEAQWPPYFTEDPQVPGLGVWECPNCYANDINPEDDVLSQHSLEEIESWFEGPPVETPDWVKTAEDFRRWVMTTDIDHEAQTMPAGQLFDIRHFTEGDFYPTIIERYASMLITHPEFHEDAEQNTRHLLWMLKELQTNRDQSLTKKHRWLGYIQRAIIEQGLTTVLAEREFTRDIFKGA